MDLGGLLRVAHALAGVGFVAGLIGFWIVTGFASRADSVGSMRLLLRAANPFAKLVTGGGIALTILGIAAALAIGRPLLGPLQGGAFDWMFVSVLLMLPIFTFLVAVYPKFGRQLRAALAAAGDDGPVTPELVSAWGSPTYWLARRYELVAVVLMLAKPF